MHILLTNDDGIHAPGLKALYDELSQVADVTVVAPSSEKSGASRSVTIKTILKMDEVYKDGKFFGYGIHGTPVDCVMLAFQQIMDKKPDYVFSGINRGANLSGHVRYSGTVSAAAEGFLQGVSAVAMSLTSFEAGDFVPSAVMARRWLETLERHKHKLPNPALYNINVPPLPVHNIKGFAAGMLSETNFGMVYEKRVSPFGDNYFWLADVEAKGNFEPESDISVIQRDYTSVTPLTAHAATDTELLELLKGVCADEK